MRQANGGCDTAVEAMPQSLVQLNVRTDMRARALGLHTMGQSALQPLGALGLGTAIAILGPQNGVALFAILALTSLTLITAFVPGIRKA